MLGEVVSTLVSLFILLLIVIVLLAILRRLGVRFILGSVDAERLGGQRQKGAGAAQKGVAQSGVDGAEKNGGCCGGCVGGAAEAERAAFLGARYLGNVGRSVMYEAADGSVRYKVYPLCCPECRKHAEGELALLQGAQASGQVVQLLHAWESREHPENHTRTDYPYLVLALEPTRSLASPDVTAIDWPQFLGTIQLAEELGAATGRDIDQSFATLQMSKRGPVLAHLDHPRAPKSMITKCLDPALFGNDADAYRAWAATQVKK